MYWKTFHSAINSIRGRILLAFLILFVLIVPFLIFAYLSLEKIDNVKELKHEIIVFDANRLKAANKFSKIIDYDSKLDSFYTAKLTKNIQDYNTYIAEAKKNLQNIKKYQDDRSVVFKKRLDKVEVHFNQFDRDVKIIIKMKQEKGFRDFGLIGKMREYVHSLESNPTNISLAEILMLRRREKDFFLRNDPYYVSKLNEEAEIIHQRLSNNGESAQEALDIIKKYQNTFNDIVLLENRIGNENEGAFYDLRITNSKLEKQVDNLYGLVDQNSKLFLGSIRLYLIIFFGITILFGVLFVFIFSSSMSRPIKRLIKNMDSISSKNFAGDERLKININTKELKKLTSTYDELVAKIRSQIQSLNNNNSELEKLNDKLVESETELKDALKLKDKFFSIISHDLRGHSGNVLTLANMLKDSDNKSDEEEKEIFIQYMADAAQNLQMLLDNLLNWAKSQMNDHTVIKRSFDLNAVIEKNIHLYNENALRKKVDIRFQNQEIVKAYADKDMIDFVIRNLLSNALKFTKQGDFISFGLEKIGNTATVKITDSGVGMTQDQVDILLDSEKEGFTRPGTENEEGTGLGLPICRDFIKRNGGSFEIESKVNEGTTFTFTTPTSLTRESILV